MVPVPLKQAATFPVTMSMRCSASCVTFWMTATGCCACTAASAVQPSSFASAFWIAACASFSLSVQKAANRHEWRDRDHDPESRGYLAYLPCAH